MEEIPLCNYYAKFPRSTPFDPDAPAEPALPPVSEKLCPSGCGFVVTWHKTHCCLWCEWEPGKHGDQCNRQLPHSATAEAAAPERPERDARSAAVDAHENACSDPARLQKQEDAPNQHVQYYAGASGNVALPVASESRRQITWSNLSETMPVAYWGQRQWGLAGGAAATEPCWSVAPSDCNVSVAATEPCRPVPRKAPTRDGYAGIVRGDFAGHEEYGDDYLSISVGERIFVRKGTEEGGWVLATVTRHGQEHTGYIPSTFWELKLR